MEDMEAEPGLRRIMFGINILFPENDDKFSEFHESVLTI